MGSWRVVARGSSGFRALCRLDADFATLAATAVLLTARYHFIRLCCHHRGPTLPSCVVSTCASCPLPNRLYPLHDTTAAAMAAAAPAKCSCRTSLAALPYAS